jgi:hypothetical protein
LNGIGKRARIGASRSAMRLSYVVTDVFREGEYERDHGALRRT